MSYELKNIFSNPQLSYIFEKHHWNIISKSMKNYNFNYKGEIADYYLSLSSNNNTLELVYTLYIEVPKDKMNDLLTLMNFVNQKTKDGFFIYDFEVKKVKFISNIQHFLQLKNKILEDVIEENLNITKNIFYNFTLTTHNLIYGEKKDQSYFELMFLKIEGCA